MGLHDNEREETMACEPVEEKSELDKIISRLQYMVDYSGNIADETSNLLDTISGSGPEPNDEPKAVQIDSKISDINYLLNIMDKRIEDFARSAHRLRTIA